MGSRFELYEDEAGEWRWRLRHDNGNVIADSGEGYASRQKARQGIESVKRTAPDAPIETL
ncbi:MAG: HVO_2922 family protein [Halanaeroarchaeum sp.]